MNIVDSGSLNVLTGCSFHAAAYQAARKASAPFATIACSTCLSAFSSLSEHPMTMRNSMCGFFITCLAGMRGNRHETAVCKFVNLCACFLCIFLHCDLTSVEQNESKFFFVFCCLSLSLCLFCVAEVIGLLILFSNCNGLWCLFYSSTWPCGWEVHFWVVGLGRASCQLWSVALYSAQCTATQQQWAVSVSSIAASHKREHEQQLTNNITN